MTDTHEDGVAITATGLIKLTIDGVEHTLRRPTIGQRRELEKEGVAVAKRQMALDERLTARAAAAKAEASDSQPAATGDASEPTVEDAQAVAAAYTAEDDTESDAIEHDFCDWWRHMFATLGTDGYLLPDDDDEMPGWLPHFGLLRKVREAWLRLPWLND